MHLNQLTLLIYRRGVPADVQENRSIRSDKHRPIKQHFLTGLQLN
jgi:hypothetical protein